MKKAYCNKVLTFGLGIFLTIQVFFTLHQVEYFPFFLFGFFSEKAPEQTVYFEIRQGGRVLELPALTDEFVQNQLHFADFYVSEKGENKGMDDLIQKRFSDPSTRGWAQNKLLAPWNKKQFHKWIAFYLKKRGFKGPFQVYRITVEATKHRKKTAHDFNCR